MTSELRVDNLKGSTTGGSINVLSEGTSVTTNLQQGLCKAFAFVDHKTDNAIDNGFNTASLTDVGSGSSKVTITNAMASATQVSGLTSYRSGAMQISGNVGTSMESTTEVLCIVMDTGDPEGNQEDSEYGMTLHGDLA